MAKGYETNQERLAVLSSFGKDLARRAKSRCELCEASGVKLSIYEVPPVPREPDFGICAFLCENCLEQADHPKRFVAGESWRFLTQSLWSEVPAIQALSLRLLRRQADSQAWAREALEDAWVDPAIEEWAAREK